MQTNLAGHDGVCRDVPDFADRPSVSGTQVLDELEVIRPQVQVELDANLQLGGIIVVFLPVHPPKVGILGRRRRLWGRRSQSKALDILALHRARGEAGVGHGERSARVPHKRSTRYSGLGVAARSVSSTKECFRRGPEATARDLGQSGEEERCRFGRRVNGEGAAQGLLSGWELCECR